MKEEKTPNQIALLIAGISLIIASMSLIFNLLRLTNCRASSKPQNNSQPMSQH